MHIVISGYYGFDNVGDETILYSIIQSLREYEPNIRITALSNHPEATKATYGIEAINRWKFKDVSRTIKSSDGLISGGGSLLQDETGLRSIPYYAGIIKLAQWHGKPTFVYAQGIGPINRSLNKWITKRVFNKVNHITVRDKDSQKLLDRIGVTQP